MRGAWMPGPAAGFLARFTTCGGSMEHVSDEREFRELAPAAAQIFSYVSANPQLAKLALGFEYGLVDTVSSRAVVKFGCRNCSSCDHAVVWVSALTRLDGTWVLSHAIGSMN